MSAFGSRFGAVVTYVLMAVAALALPIETSEPIHLHHGEAPALYNGDCLLAALAAFHGTSALPESPPSTWVVLAAGVVLIGSSERPRLSRHRHTESRAPPTPLS